MDSETRTLISEFDQHAADLIGLVDAAESRAKKGTLLLHSLDSLKGVLLIADRQILRIEEWIPIAELHAFKPEWPSRKRQLHQCASTLIRITNDFGKGIPNGLS